MFTVKLPLSIQILISLVLFNAVALIVAIVYIIFAEV